MAAQCLTLNELGGCTKCHKFQYKQPKYYNASKENWNWHAFLNRQEFQPFGYHTIDLITNEMGKIPVQIRQRFHARPNTGFQNSKTLSTIQEKWATTMQPSMPTNQDCSLYKHNPGYKEKTIKIASTTIEGLIHHPKPIEFNITPWYTKIRGKKGARSSLRIVTLWILPIITLVKQRVMRSVLPLFLAVPWSCRDPDARPHGLWVLLLFLAVRGRVVILMLILKGCGSCSSS